LRTTATVVGSGVSIATGRDTGLLLATTCGAELCGTLGVGLLTATRGGASVGVCAGIDVGAGVGTGPAAAIGVGTSTNGLGAGVTTMAGVGVT
jgi:hypothetical protein